MKKNILAILLIAILVLVIGALGVEIFALNRKLNNLAYTRVGVDGTAVSAIGGGTVSRDKYAADTPLKDNGLEEGLLAELDRMEKNINGMFFAPYMQPAGGGIRIFMNRTNIFNPDIDISETKDEYIVTADLPGIEKDKINIELKNHNLIISGEREKEKESGKNGRFYMRERNYGSFAKMIAVPDYVRTDKAVAQYKGGVLSVTFPKIMPGDKSSAGNKITVL